MQEYKKYLGMVVEGMVLDTIETYYDLSTDRMEYAFGIAGHSLGINCDLVIKKYFS